MLKIFASNILGTLENSVVLSRLLLAVFIFFVSIFLLGEVLSSVFKLRYTEHALLTITIVGHNDDRPARSTVNLCGDCDWQVAGIPTFNQASQPFAEVKRQFGVPIII